MADKLVATELELDELLEPLKHYGILGMRWGIRRERGPDGLVGSRRASEKKQKQQRLAEIQKEYGRLEDQTTYGKNENKKLNEKIFKRLETLDREMKQLEGKKSKPVSEDHKESRQLKKNAPKGLSTKELQTLNQRLQLERQYKDLSPKMFQRGEKFAKGLLSAGTTVASLYALSQTDLGKDVIAAITMKKWY